eukprot:g6121.t1
MYFDGSVATGVFSVVVGSYGCWIWLTKNAATQADRVFGHDVRVDFVARLMISFFVLNLIVDHVVCPVVKMVEAGAAPVKGTGDEEVTARYHASALILWELSTPFLNYRIIGLELGWNKSCKRGRINTFACMQAGFGISFLCARIVIGLPSSVFCCYDMVRMMLFRHAKTFALMWSGRRPGADDGDLRQQMLAWSAPSDQEMDSYLLAWCTCTGNLVLCVLNVFWAWKIVTRARKLHFSGSDAAAHNKKATD